MEKGELKILVLLKKEDVFRYANRVFMPFSKQDYEYNKGFHRARISSTKSSLIDTLKMYLVIKGFILEHIKLSRTLYDNLGQGSVQLGQYPKQRCMTTMEGMLHMSAPHQRKKGHR